MFSVASEPVYQTVYCKSWEVRAIVRGLGKEGCDIVSREFITKGKVVLVARDRFR